jgi:histidinol-phosphate aminotransferase
MKEFWSKRIENLQPYTAGEQPKDKKYVKLNTNENPYPPSRKVTEAINSSLNDLRLYPDPDCTEISKPSARFTEFQLGKSLRGTVSDEILAMCFLAFFDPGKPVTFPDITYNFYPVYCGLYGLDYRLVPLNDDFTVPVRQLFQTPGGVVIANPNAPTGIALELPISNASFQKTRIPL